MTASAIELTEPAGDLRNWRLVHAALGSPREYVRAGLRKINAASHAIYYFHDSKTVRVSRILHGSMDAGAVL